MCGCKGEIKQACDCPEKRKKKQIAMVVIAFLFGLAAYMTYRVRKTLGESEDVRSTKMVLGFMMVVLPLGSIAALVNAVNSWYVNRTKADETTPSV
jgi:ABC-type Co2+ transport system permease subunit